MGGSASGIVNKDIECRCEIIDIAEFDAKDAVESASVAWRGREDDCGLRCLSSEFTKETESGLSRVVGT